MAVQPPHAACRKMQLLASPSVSCMHATRLDGQIPRSTSSKWCNPCNQEGAQSRLIQRAGTSAARIRVSAVSTISASTAPDRTTSTSSRGDSHNGENIDTSISKCRGAMIGAMCGNVLGAPVQNDRHWMVTRRFAGGLTDFWRFDIGEQPVPFGHYTGDFSLLLATARSLVATGTCEATDMASKVLALNLVPEQGDGQGEAKGFQRRYSPYAKLIMAALEGPGMPLASLPYLAEKYLDDTTPRHSHISGDRAEREPYGPSDNGGAARILPVALAYREASPAAREQAVQEACLFSHSHPLGLDGARVAAAAIVWLYNQPAPGASRGSGSGGDGDGGCSMEAACEQACRLLEHLREVAQTEDMRGKLLLVQRELFQVPQVTNWRQFYRGPEWTRLTAVLTRLSFHGYATAGSEGVAVALWACLTSWAHPEQAVIMAASFAGSAPVTSQLAGAFAGALHGSEWVPHRWWDNLENGSGGRNDVVRLADSLAGLRCTSSGQLPEEYLEKLQQEVQAESAEAAAAAAPVAEATQAEK